MNKLIKYLLMTLALTFSMNTYSQVRPNKFYDYSNPPRWQRNSEGNIEIVKDGYTYNNAEFKMTDLSEGDALIIYSITEDVTFLCKNFHSVPANIPIKVKWPSGSWVSYPNSVYYAKANGEYWVIDKGVYISGKLKDNGICMYNCGDQQQYYSYVGNNGIIYGIKAGVRPNGTGVSTYIQMPKEELVSIPAQ